MVSDVPEETSDENHFLYKKLSAHKADNTESRRHHNNNNLTVLHKTTFILQLTAILQIYFCYNYANKHINLYYFTSAANAFKC